MKKQEGTDLTLSFRPMLLWSMIAILIGFGCGGADSKIVDETTIFLVRHAEKVDQSRDPDLSPEGKARARRLADILERAGLSALYATEYKRTQQTLAPLADKLGLKVQVIPASSEDELVSSILSENQSGSVAVCGHSDTVPELVRQLTGEEVPAIGATEYDNLYIVRTRGLRSGFVLRLRYGRLSKESEAPIEREGSGY